MTKRNPNPRLAKIHRSYTVEEVACLYGTHRNTVRNWIKQGLAINDDKRPILILGRALVAFLHIRREKNKKTCQLSEIYCVKCRIPKAPAGDMVEYQAQTEMLGNLIAICPDCNSIMNRRVSFSKLAQFCGHMTITMPHALQHINESNQPSVNCDFK